MRDDSGDGASGGGAVWRGRVGQAGWVGRGVECDRMGACGAEVSRRKGLH